MAIACSKCGATLFYRDDVRIAIVMRQQANGMEFKTMEELNNPDKIHTESRKEITEPGKWKCYACQAEITGIPETVKPETVKESKKKKEEDPFG